MTCLNLYTFVNMFVIHMWRNRNTAWDVKMPYKPFGRPFCLICFVSQNSSCRCVTSQTFLRCRCTWHARKLRWFPELFLLHPPALESPTAFCFACLLCLICPWSEYLVLGLRFPNPDIVLVYMPKTGQGYLCLSGTPNSRMWVSNGFCAKDSVEIAHCITGIHLIWINICQIINYLTRKMFWELIR